MNDKLLKILVAPLFTEKSFRLGNDKHQQIAFEVLTSATKVDIKAAVEAMFDVKVVDVKTVNVKGSARRFGKTSGRTKDWKKAYVRLAEGAKIDFGGTEA